jgi:hypothetical protein
MDYVGWRSPNLDGQIVVLEFLCEAEIERKRGERILANHRTVTESAAKKKKELEQSSPELHT